MGMVPLFLGRIYRVLLFQFKFRIVSVEVSNFTCQRFDDDYSWSQSAQSPMF